MDVRGRRLRKQSEDAAAFISSTATDERMASEVVKVNLAHVMSLVRSGSVPGPAGARILAFLRTRRAERKPASVFEDFHQLLEQEAVDLLGVETAGYMNLGKSRNDQVATAIRMELRDRIIELLACLAEMQGSLLQVAEEHGAQLAPGYTHLQRAQPVTLAHYAFAYFEAFQRDSERLLQLYARVNISPMGSGALGGTDVRLDRKFVAEMLGFDGITSNAMDSVASRDLVLEGLSCTALVMTDISRLAEEQILWSSSEFGFAELPDEFSASSSMMPQKKNPVVAEVARAKAGSVLGALVASFAIMKSLPFAYNLDLQEITPHLWRAFDDASASVRLLGRSLPLVTVRDCALSESTRGDYSTATALANYLVSEHALSFREAHAIVGELVRSSFASGVPLAETAARELPAVSERSGRRLTITASDARDVLDPLLFVKRISTEGGANPEYIPGQLRRSRAALLRTRRRLSGCTSRLARSERALAELSASMSREVKRKQ